MAATDSGGGTGSGTGSGSIDVRRGAVIAWISALVLLLFVAAFDNQWTEHWRQSQGSAGPLVIGAASPEPGGVRSWTGEPIGYLSLLSWRVSSQPGESGRELVGNLLAVVLTALVTGLLIWLVGRGVATTRGRLPLFFGAWFSVAPAATIGMIIGTAVAGTDHLSFTNGGTYYLFMSLGLDFALFIGWLIGLTAVVVYNLSGGLDDLTFPSASSAYQPPLATTYDYGMSGLAADYGIGPTQTAPPPYYPPSAPDPGEAPTKPIDPFNRNY